MSKTISIVQREENQGKHTSMDKVYCKQKIGHQEESVLQLLRAVVRPCTYKKKTVFITEKK